jgi:hypothetical protein
MPSTTPTHPDRVTSSPVSPPVIVGTNDGEAGDKHEHPGQIDDRRYLRIVKMRLYRGELRREHHHECGTYQPRDLLRICHGLT